MAPFLLADPPLSSRRRRKKNSIRTAGPVQSTRFLGLSFGQIPEVPTNSADFQTRFSRGKKTLARIHKNSTQVLAQNPVQGKSAEAFWGEDLGRIPMDLGECFGGTPSKESGFHGLDWIGPNLTQNCGTRSIPLIPRLEFQSNPWGS